MYLEKTAGAAFLSFVIDCRALYPDLRVETMPARHAGPANPQAHLLATAARRLPVVCPSFA
jgi:hypothetical protein